MAGSESTAAPTGTRAPELSIVLPVYNEGEAVEPVQDILAPRTELE